MNGMAVLEGATGRTFLAVSARVAPRTRALDDAGREELARLVEDALARKGPEVGRRVALFLAIVRWLPILRHGRTFDRLDAERQDAVLARLFRSRIGPLRKGFWGVKTLAFLGCYGRPGAGEEIGYRPSRDGNARLRA